MNPSQPTTLLSVVPQLPFTVNNGGVLGLNFCFSSICVSGMWQVHLMLALMEAVDILWVVTLVLVMILVLHVHVLRLGYVNVQRGHKLVRLSKSFNTLLYKGSRLHWITLSVWDVLLPVDDRVPSTCPFTQSDLRCLNVLEAAGYSLPSQKGCFALRSCLSHGFKAIEPLVMPSHGWNVWLLFM